MGTFTVEELLEAFASFVSYIYNVLPMHIVVTHDAYQYYFIKFNAGFYNMQEDFDDVCLGHLFTYRDFQGD